MSERDGQPETEGPAGEDKTGGAPSGKREVGGRAGPEPTRYGDWEVGGICTDF